MSSPVQPEVGGTQVTLEEIEQQTATPVKPELDKIKLEDGVPEEFKGKTVAEIVAMTKGALDSLKTSEQRRLELEGRVAAPPAPPAPPEPKPEPELTKEQIADLYQKDPMAAIEYMAAQAERRATANLERRIGPLVSGTAVGAEEAARRKYPTEFELFGSEIKRFVDASADKTIWSQPKTWDDLVAYVRGQPENFDKLVAHKANKTTEQQRIEAQAQQALTAGASVRTTITPPPPSEDNAGLDPLELEFAKGLGMTPADYKLWKGKR